MRFADLVESENAIDDRSEAAALEERDHPLREFPRQHDLLLERPGAQNRPDDRRSLAQQNSHVQLRRSTSSQTYDHDSSLDRHYAKIAFEIVTTNQLEQAVYSIAANGFFNLCHPVTVPGVDRNIQSEITRPLQLLWRSRGTNHPCTGQLRQLERCRADSTAGSVYQQ